MVKFLWDITYLCWNLTGKEIQDLFWEHKRLSQTEHCITLRRRFFDPEYPQKFDTAFRRLTGDFDNVRFH
jgi:hypothetical protein